MNKKIILVLILILILVGCVFYYSKMQKNKLVEEAVTMPETQSGVLPAMDTGAVNPLESAQNANPYDQTNPFSSIKTNPFE